MSLVGVHTAVGKQSEEMEAASAGTGIFHRAQQNGVRKEFAVLNHQLDASAVHVHDASGADVEMSDFAVSHLAIRQANVTAAGLNESVGIVAQQAVICWLAGEGDGVGFGLGAI